MNDIFTMLKYNLVFYDMTFLCNDFQYMPIL